MDSEPERTSFVQPEGGGSQMRFGDHVGIDEFCKVSDNRTICGPFFYLQYVICGCNKSIYLSSVFYI